MFDSIKTYINTILFSGILFVIIKLIVPNGKLKKYINVLIGVITIIIVFSPVITLVKNNNNLQASDILLNIASLDIFNSNYTDLSSYDDVNKNNVRESFKESVENDIKEKIKKEANVDSNVTVNITDTYNIDSIDIKINSKSNIDIPSYISNEYDIDKSKITVEEVN